MCCLLWLTDGAGDLKGTFAAGLPLFWIPGKTGSELRAQGFCISENPVSMDASCHSACSISEAALSEAQSVRAFARASQSAGAWDDLAPTVTRAHCSVLWGASYSFFWSLKYLVWVRSISFKDSGKKRQTYHQSWRVGVWRLQELVSVLRADLRQGWAPLSWLL